MKYRVEEILPNENIIETKENQVEKMFDDISENYDLMNSIMSFGLDKYWRKKAIKKLKKERSDTIIDIACGTGQLCFCANKYLKPKEILACDISEKMLEIAIKKAKLKEINNINFLKENCDNIQNKNNSFDIAMIGFGLRNFENINNSLLKIYQLLKENGSLMILELSKPTVFPIKQLYTILYQADTYTRENNWKEKTAIYVLTQEY